MNSVTTSNFTPLLEVCNIHKFFGKVHALKGVDFMINKGEIVGLIGDNGAGKSTLIKIISGVIQPDAGEILWEGKKVKIRSVNDARKLGIETVFQEQALIDYFSASRNIFLGRELHKTIGPFKIIDYNAMNLEAEALLKELKLRASPETEVRFLSGGEKQGVAVSRALKFRSKLIILDEPTRALSVAGVAQVMEFVRKLKREGIACIFITHTLSHVYPVADRIVMLSRGEKVLDVKREAYTIDELENLILAASSKAGEL